MSGKIQHSASEPRLQSRDERLDSTSLERIVPDDVSPSEATGSETLRLHIERYQFAKQNLVPGSLLDIACGVGYGTALMAESTVVTSVLGVDISLASVEYARQRYASAGPRTSYICSDALEFRPSERFENIVSLETIEHVDDPRGFFAHLVSLLAPGGRLVASVPVTPSVDANPYHKSNFSSRSFRRMGEALSLKCVASLNQIQPFNPVAVMMRKEARTVSLRGNLASFYVTHPSHLLLRVWSTMRYGFANRYLTVVWQQTE